MSAEEFHQGKMLADCADWTAMATQCYKTRMRPSLPHSLS